ncbi:DUF1697 domain-containing protein [Paenibacillus filicis]|uniref:DUF1697 domain-containing protein n=1 Tax=Paenibacillus gyeongsangnamensis TaxID=3388067 RepID=A0ABT4QM65_9BACL|nr:DUF1697 domain-containing protein [Paenibacillus filicis]MCZ8517840.1 DUF1697 domain-containing protein [Paenibacillus filicis]
MTIYIAFLRGINVGGHNKIKMAELKNIFQSIGCKRVQTYIQSGNVLFESAEDADTLRKRIEQETAKVFSFTLTVILRTSLELERIIENCPFTEAVLKEAEVSTDVETFYVSILLEPPTQEGIKQVSAFQNENDEFRINGREVYLLLRDGVRNSKLANNLYKLNVPSTMRNWKTINKLNALAEV